MAHDSYTRLATTKSSNGYEYHGYEQHEEATFGRHAEERWCAVYWLGRWSEEYGRDNGQFPFRGDDGYDCVVNIPTREVRYVVASQNSDKEYGSYHTLEEALEAMYVRRLARHLGAPRINHGQLH